MNIAQKATFERLLPEAHKELIGVTVIGNQVLDLNREQLLVALMMVHRELKKFAPKLVVTKTLI